MRHAPSLTSPVGTLTVAVIEPPRLAQLVPTAGLTHAVATRLLRAARRAVPAAPVASPAQPETFPAAGANPRKVLVHRRPIAAPMDFADRS